MTTPDDQQPTQPFEDPRFDEGDLLLFRDCSWWYQSVITSAFPVPSGHERYGETQGDGSDYCECGQFLGHDFPPQETERRWFEHWLPIVTSAPIPPFTRVGLDGDT